MRERASLTARHSAVISVIFLAVLLWFALPEPSRSQATEPPPIEQSLEPSQTFTVTSTANSGTGTLRQAITDANANAGLDAIAFDLAGSGIRIIDIGSVLPTVTSPVIIDGTTQPGYAGTPVIFIRGNGTSEAMKITAGGSSLRGLTFGNFDGTTTDGAINFSTAAGNVVTACTFGVLGDSTIGRNSNEVIVIDGTANNRIGGSTPAERNYFGGDTFNRGVVIKNGGTDNRIVGNWFGVAPNGTAIPNRISVVIQDSANNSVGGLVGVSPGGACTGECNVISGNDDTIGGVRIIGASSTGNSVVSNFVGLLADGQTVHRNRNVGIRVTGAPNNRIGGATAAERNVITGNGFTGVVVDTAGASGNIISGNYIGLKTDGVGTTTTTATTSSNGILLNPGTAATRIGGVTAGERNIISGNRIGIFSSQSSNNVIQGNYIGTDASGTARSTTLSTGVWIDGGSNNTIGGTAGTTRGGSCTGACNLISGNGVDGTSHGVHFSTGTSGNTIDGNFIGLDVTGTDSMLNGITTDGATFNGSAIQISNSSNITIGRDTTVENRALESGPWQDASAGQQICIRDNNSGNHMQIDLGTGIYGAKYCQTNTFYQGINFVDTSVPDLITTFAPGYLPDAPFINRLYGESAFNTQVAGAKIRFIGPAGSGFGFLPFYRFYANDNQASQGPCDPCNPNALLMLNGPTRIQNTFGIKIDNAFMGLQTNGIVPLSETHIYTPVEILGDSHDITIKSPTIFVPPERPAVGLFGSGNNISWQVVTAAVYGDGLRPRNPPITTTAPTVYDEVGFQMLGQNLLRLRGQLRNAEANKPFRIELQGVEPFQLSPLDPLQYEFIRSLNTSFDVPIDGTGGGTIDKTFTELESVAISQFPAVMLTGASVTATSGRNGEEPDGEVLGNVSRMFGPVFVPRPQFDFDRDGKTDISVYRPGANTSSVSNWYTLLSNTGTSTAQPFGNGGDLPVTGDYNGDRAPNFAVWRPSDRRWYLSRLGGNPATNFDALQWGNSTDIPVTGDFDGDDRLDLAVFRPSEGNWYVRNSSTGEPSVRQWGLATDKLVPEDYDGDGRTDLAVFRNGVWYISGCLNCAPRYEFFGISTDIPVPADYDGDGKADIAVWRPSTGVWYLLRSTDGLIAYQWGVSTDVPVNGDFDADGKNDIAIFRPSTGDWWILQSDGGTQVIHWGQSGDIPVNKFPGQ